MFTISKLEAELWESANLLPMPKLMSAEIEV